jgi:hypothetical protein
MAQMNPDTQQFARAINKSVLTLATSRPVTSARFYVVVNGRLSARTALQIQPEKTSDQQNEMINNGLLVIRR